MKKTMIILGFLAATLLTRGLLAQDSSGTGGADPQVAAETQELLVGMGVPDDALSGLDPSRLDGTCAEGRDLTACAYTYDTESYTECRALAAVGVAVRAARAHRLHDRRPFLIRVFCKNSHIDVAWRRGDVRYEQTGYPGDAVLSRGKVNRKHSPLAS